MKYLLIVDTQNAFITGALGTLKKDCCAGSTPEKHEAAMKVMESCQIDIL